MAILGPFDYYGGWNTKAGPYDVPANSVVDVQNMELVYGRYSKKKGNTKWSATAHPGGGAIRGLTFFQSLLIAYSGSKIAKISATTTGGSWTDITGSVSFAPSNNAWMAALNNILVIGGSGATPIQWTGSGNCTNLGGSPPSGCVCGTMVNNYIFMGNNSSFPSRVFWSNVLDPNTWQAANYVDVINSDTSSVNVGIQALFPFGEDLLIFKSNSVSRFYTNQISGALGPLVTLTEKFGCAGPSCVDRLPDGRIVFIGYNNHIYIYDGNTFDDISDAAPPRSNIQLTLNGLQFKTSGFNQGFIQVYQARNQIWVSYPFSWTSALGTLYAAVIFIYDYVNGCWVGPYVDQWAMKAVNYLTSDSEFLITGAHDGFLYQEDSGDTNSNTEKNSSAFDGFLTKSIVLGPDNRNFYPRSLFFGLSSAALSATAYWGANGFRNPALSKAVTITGSAKEQKKVIPLTSASNSWNTGQFRFDGAISNQPFVIAPFYLSDDIEDQV